MSGSFLKGVIRSWRGIFIGDRPRLMRQMAKRMGAPEVSLDNVALGTCLYCQETTRCEASFEAGGGAKVDQFCPNAERFRAAAAPAL